jgi:hypothetical protein
VVCEADESRVSSARLYRIILISLDVGSINGNLQREQVRTNAGKLQPQKCVSKVRALVAADLCHPCGRLGLGFSLPAELPPQTDHLLSS